MKINLILICFSLVLASSLGALAGDQPSVGPKLKTTAAATGVSHEKSKAHPKLVQKEQTVELTGSHIKQAFRRSGRVTDGPTQVVVIDRDSIERSGAADLRQVLSLSGVR